MDLAIDDEILLEADARELNRRVQDLRKTAALKYEQRIRLFVPSNPFFDRLVASHGDYLRSQLLATSIEFCAPPPQAVTTDVEFSTHAVASIGFAVVNDASK
jgi:isoleucyl-tRNA synthetase